MSLFTAMTVASLLVSGMGVAILGSIKLPLARRLAIDVSHEDVKKVFSS